MVGIDEVDEIGEGGEAEGDGCVDSGLLVIGEGKTDSSARRDRGVRGEPVGCVVGDEDDVLDIVVDDGGLGDDSNRKDASVVKLLAATGVVPLRPRVRDVRGRFIGIIDDVVSVEADNRLGSVVGEGEVGEANDE